MRGRKPKLTPELTQRIVEFVRAGNYLETAAVANDIHRSTLHRYLERGKNETRGIYHQFYLAVEKAQAEAELRDMLQIGKAATTDWRAAAWRLERRAPRRFGSQVQATVREEMNSMLAHIEKVVDSANFERVIKSLEGVDDRGVGSGSPAEDSSSVEEVRARLLEHLEECAKGMNHAESPRNRK